MCSFTLFHVRIYSSAKLSKVDACSYETRDGMKYGNFFEQENRPVQGNYVCDGETVILKYTFPNLKQILSNYAIYEIRDDYNTVYAVGNVSQAAQNRIGYIPELPRNVIDEFMTWEQDTTYLVPTTDCYKIVSYQIKQVPVTDVCWYQKAGEWLYGTYGEALYAADVEVT